ncbi:MAG: type II toxin-antitoxin system HicB family antitoxin [Thermoproteota archaeon]|jgi:predicted RNase H-like HicB family nuclease|nr:type II toxin-antitoxin system HicB family antitoxin [Nitrosopumilaceae archaeon]
MVEKRKFTVNVQKATEGGYSGRCLELPGAISEGETLKELKANMKEAILLVLESIKKDTKSDDKLVIEISS